MADTHDLQRQISALQQAVSQDRTPVGFLLGAGAPFSVKVASTGAPLVPDIAGMTLLVAEDLAKKPCADVYARFLECFSKDGVAAPNIEGQLSRARGLLSVLGSGTIHGLTAPQLNDLEKAMASSIAAVARVALPDAPTPFHQLAMWLSASSTRQCPAELFTTNYDMLLEQALDASRVPYFDGFVGSHRTFLDVQAMEEDPLPLRWVRLWKLHGSVNWRRSSSGDIYRGYDNDSDIPVIHPSHLKYEQSRRMPYLAMLDRLRAFLRRPKALLITSGFAFRDDHLNEVLSLGLQGNGDATIIALSFGAVTRTSELGVMASQRPNLVVLSPNQGIIGTRVGAWLPCEQPDGSVPPGIQWPTGAPTPPPSPQCTLGDFQVLGSFLADRVGTQSSTAPHAR